MERKEEFLRIIDGLSRHLEFLEYAGVKYLPAPLRAPVSRADIVPAPPGGRRDDVFCIWRLAGAVAFVEGARVPEEEGAEPFPPGHTVQFEKLARWMGGELGIKGFSAGDGWRGEFPARSKDRDEKLAAQVLANPPRLIVALGPLAASALLGSPDVAALRGRFHDLNGTPALATHSPGEMLRDPALKKEAHEDLLMALGRLK